MALMRQVSVDGKYYILITLFGRELRGSPFKAVLLPGKHQLTAAELAVSLQVPLSAEESPGLA
jgi:hypothetical protein